MLCVGVLAAFPIAAAQPVPEPTRSTYFYRSVNFNAQPLCVTTNVETPGIGSTSASCTAHGATYAGFAENINGLTRSRASVSGSSLIAGNSGNDAWGSSSSAWWRDRLTLTSGAATEMEITMRWTGSVAASVTANGQSADASAFWGLQAFGPGFARLMPDYLGYASAFARFDYGLAHSSVIDDLQTFRFSLLGTSGSLVPYIDLVHRAVSGATIHDFLAAPGSAFAGSAATDMSHTGTITGLSFLDAAGNDITNQVTYDFVNGTQIYATAITPEPATVTLLGIGLAVMGAWRRRRRPG